MDFEKKYQAEYEKLNNEQKLAVDSIDGPVMVLAGPGTGKTQLLSMRVANILRQTDMNPENILCLTFTDAASQNMTERMSRLFGLSAYDVAVHTFHSFASRAINSYNEYFGSQSNFSVASEIEKLEILNDILRNLPHDNPWAGVNIDGITARNLKKVKGAISDIKRYGALTAEKLSEIGKENLDFINLAEPIFAEMFNDRISKKNLPLYESGYYKLSEYPNKNSTLAKKIINDLADAVNLAIENNDQKPISNFKGRDGIDFNKKTGTIRDRKKTEGILAIADIYKEYNERLAEKELFDFDDMIVTLVEQLENNPDFRADLQEQFQYILVDEFQDTNDAQMRILYALADDPQSNIMTVGDDDQGIYSFQGANLNNLQKFKEKYPGVKLIPLFRNYRSEREILDLADQVIDQSEVRLKRNFFEKLEKLMANKEKQEGTKVEFIKMSDIDSEMAWVAESVAREISENPDREIAIISRKNAELINIVPYLHRVGITDIEYENDENILEDEVVDSLLTLVRAVILLGDNRHTAANELIPEIISHPAWGIPRETIWRISLNASKSRRTWLEEMLDSDNENIKSLAQWLIDMSMDVKHTPLEESLDKLFNKAYKEYYFGDQKLHDDPAGYVNFLENLIRLREVAREIKQNPNLKTFIKTLDLYKRYDQKIKSSHKFGNQPKVHLVTAHKSKGLEFDSVYVINASKDSWLKIKNDSLMPSNLKNIKPPTTQDENLRIIFVAITRAKHKLFISSAPKNNQKGSDQTILPTLGEIKIREVSPEIISPIERSEIEWFGDIHNITPNEREVLVPKLKNYKLNATAVNSFVNLKYSGPKNFLQNNLLRLPSARSASADYGTAVHETFNRAHNFFLNKKQKPTSEKIKEIFTEEIDKLNMSSKDRQHFLGKGLKNLPKYIENFAFEKGQESERSFNAQVDGMQLTGKLDLIKIDNKAKTITIWDHKTGKSFDKLNQKIKSGEVKSHTYWQQLMFYKILVENANNLPGYRVDRAFISFVDAEDGDAQILEINYDEDELIEFKKLLKVIWRKIQDLDFPNVDDFSDDLVGILDFEKSLLKEADE